MAGVLLIRLKHFAFLHYRSFIYYLTNIFCFLLSVTAAWHRNFRVAALENLLVLYLISFLKSKDCVKNQQLCSLLSESGGRGVEMREVIVKIAEEEEKILSTEMESLQPKKEKKK